MQNYAEGWTDGKWEEKVDERPCIEKLMYSKDKQGYYRWYNTTCRANNIYLEPVCYIEMSIISYMSHKFSLYTIGRGYFMCCSERIVKIKAAEVTVVYEWIV